LNKEQVLEIIQMLSYSQGMYGRLLRGLAEATEEEIEEFFSLFTECKDSVDVVMVIEQ